MTEIPLLGLKKLAIFLCFLKFMHLLVLLSKRGKKVNEGKMAL